MKEESPSFTLRDVETQGHVVTGTAREDPFSVQEMGHHLKPEASAPNRKMGPILVSLERHITVDTTLNSVGQL